MLEDLKDASADYHSSLTAQDFISSLIFRHYPTRDVGKKYWVAEWSWSLIIDGIFPHEQTLRDVQVFIVKESGAIQLSVPIYQTTGNARFYFPWEVFDSEDDARFACHVFDAWGYDYDKARVKTLRRIEQLSGKEFEYKGI